MMLTPKRRNRCYAVRRNFLKVTPVDARSKILKKAPAVLTDLLSYRAGYFDGDLRFEIHGLKGQRQKVPAFVLATRSCLMRGAPTRPSPVLEQQLNFRWSDIDKAPLFLAQERPRPLWQSTIKGAASGRFNPALDFFEQLLPSALGGWMFVVGLLVPEYRLFDDLGAPQKLTAGGCRRQVDFYLPQAALVIEIDGSQHKNQLSQVNDKERDEFLSEFGIQTLRIDTVDLDPQKAAFKKFIKDLRQAFADSPELVAYREQLRPQKTDDLKLQLTAAMRLQISILALIERGQLGLGNANWNLTVTQDFSPTANEKWAKSAIEDLFNWFQCFADVTVEIFQRPQVTWVRDGLKVEINLLHRTDEAARGKPWVTCCTSAIQYTPLADLEKFYKDPNCAPTALPSQALPANLPRAAVEHLMRLVFGHESLRPGQLELVDNILRGRKSLGLMPTGAGKSLAFQLPGLLNPGTTIVVVPIRALGRDHAVELDAYGFSGRAINIDSSVAPEKRELIYEKIKRGVYRFVFVAPERFQTTEFKDVVAELSSRSYLNYFVVDEAHCLSEWGHDFRPSYLTLPGTFSDLSADTPVICVTATAAENTKKDLQAEFDIPDDAICFAMHRGRPELSFSVTRTTSPLKTVVAQIAKASKRQRGSDGGLPGIIFSRFVNKADETSAPIILRELSKQFPKLRLGLFTGSKPKAADYKFLTSLFREPVDDITSFDAYKNEVQKRWKEDKIDLVVATSAFGMGINKANVRFTIHAGMPSSMEAFYQEAGRAGRDELPASGDLLFTPEQDAVQTWYGRIESNPGKTTISAEIDKVPVAAQGNLRTQLWFMNLSNSDVKVDLERLWTVHQKLPAKGGQCLLDRGDYRSVLPDGQSFQMTLFRLYQLGVIKSWDVKNWGIGAGGVSQVVVDVNKHDILSAIESLEGRIAAVTGINGLNRLRGAVPAIRVAGSSQKAWHLLYQQLLEWVQRSQTTSRLASMKALYDECLNFRPGGADAFKERMENFFKIDMDSAALSILKDMALEVSVAPILHQITAPDGSIKSSAHIRKLAAQVDRLRQSTAENPSINLASGVLRLLASGPADPAWPEHLRVATSEVGAKFWLRDGQSLVRALTGASDEIEEAIVAFLLKEEMGLEELAHMNELFKTDVTRLRLLVALANEIEKEVSKDG